MPHKRYKHSKYRKKRPAQMPYNRYKRCERHKGPTPMPHKRYTLRFATPRHATPRHATENITYTNKNFKKEQPERFINTTNAVNATRDPPQCPINTVHAVNATRSQPNPPKAQQTLQPPQKPLNLIPKLALSVFERCEL